MEATFAMHPLEYQGLILLLQTIKLNTQVVEMPRWWMALDARNSQMEERRTARLSAPRLTCSLELKLVPQCVDELEFGNLAIGKRVGSFGNQDFSNACGSCQRAKSPELGRGEEARGNVSCRTQTRQDTGAHQDSYAR